MELHNAGYGGLVELGSPRFAVDFRFFCFFLGKWGGWEGEDGGKVGWYEVFGRAWAVGSGVEFGGMFFLMTGSLWADEDCGGKA